MAQTNHLLKYTAYHIADAIREDQKWEGKTEAEKGPENIKEEFKTTNDPIILSDIYMWRDKTLTSEFFM